MATIQKNAKTLLAGAAIALMGLNSSGQLVKAAQGYYYPQATEASIREAVNAANTAGGGTIFYPNAEVTLTAPLPLNKSVAHVGVMPTFAFTSVPDSSSIQFTGGSRLKGDGTFPCFQNNDADLSGPAASQAAFNALGVTGAFIQNFAVTGFSRGISSGGDYGAGMFYSVVDNIYIKGCTDWGAKLENFQHCSFSRIYTYGNAVGGQLYRCSATSAILNCGNSEILSIFNVAGAGAFRRGLIVDCIHATSSMNDMVIIKAQCNMESTALSQAATMANGSPNITVTDGSVFAVDMPVNFAASANGFQVKQTYFVTSVVGNVIQLANAMEGAAINATNNAAITIQSRGFPNMEIKAHLGATNFQPINVFGLDMEGGKTCALYLQNCNSVNVHFSLLEPIGNTTHHVVGRSSKGSLNFAAVGGSTGYSVDLDAGCAGMQASGNRFNMTSIGNNTVLGHGISNSLQAASITGISQNTAAIFLGNTSPTIFIDGGMGNISLSRGIKYAQKTFASGATIGTSGGQGKSWVWTGTADGAATLPAVADTLPADNIGTEITVSNPTAFALTINTTSSQNIVGGGTSATSFVLAANSNVTLTACKSGSTLYWARH